MLPFAVSSWPALQAMQISGCVCCFVTFCWAWIVLRWHPEEHINQGALCLTRTGVCLRRYISKCVRLSLNTIQNKFQIPLFRKHIQTFVECRSCGFAKALTRLAQAFYPTALYPNLTIYSKCRHFFACLPWWHWRLRNRTHFAHPDCQPDVGREPSNVFAMFRSLLVEYMLVRMVNRPVIP